MANDLMLKDVQDRVSIAVYFKPSVSEPDVMQVRDEFSKYQEVASINYVSKDKALEKFKERNNENETIKKSLEEIGDNPLGATLNIKAKQANDYELIAKSIEESKYKDLISKVNYHKYKTVIENLNKEIGANQRMAIILGLTLSIVAVLITFNSIRITIYAYRQEIEIMRLVGASNTYIRFPFVWEGIIYGLIAGFLVVPMIFFYLKFFTAESSTGSVLPFSNAVYLKTYLTEYFIKHIFMIGLMQLVAGIFLGVISSMIAMRKYLKV